ncbi:hypothetical protein RLW55_14190 [Hyphomicrobium sp. B1]|uniref:hypothetical protein n=1 Tax=Hyphomicrobium sp. B1 TaxID=3075651 RepID=UPI003C3027AC
MNLEEQKYMALEGIHTWAHATVRHAAELSKFQRSFAAGNFIGVRRDFESERHIFLIVAHRLMSYINWATDLNFIDTQIFNEVKRFELDIKTMRDLNEHVIEYFRGGGRRPQLWSTENADASSTMGTRIGDRLDWLEVKDAVETLIKKSPPYYHPAA